MHGRIGKPPALRWRLFFMGQTYTKDRLSGLLVRRQMQARTLADLVRALERLDIR